MTLWPSSQAATLVAAALTDIDEGKPFGPGSGDIALLASAVSLAEHWSIKLERWGQGGIRITMPAEAIKLGLAPSKGEQAVVFRLDELIEIWSLDQWNSYQKEHRGSIPIHTDLIPN
jgi:hypothetical protein